MGTRTRATGCRGSAEPGAGLVSGAAWELLPGTRPRWWTAWVSTAGWKKWVPPPRSGQESSPASAMLIEPWAKSRSTISCKAAQHREQGLGWATGQGSTGLGRATRKRWAGLQGRAGMLGRDGQVHAQHKHQASRAVGAGAESAAPTHLVRNSSRAAGGCASRLCTCCTRARLCKCTLLDKTCGSRGGGHWAAGRPGGASAHPAACKAAAASASTCTQCF